MREREIMAVHQVDALTETCPVCIIDHHLQWCINNLFHNGIFEEICSMFIIFGILASIVTYIFSQNHICFTNSLRNCCKFIFRDIWSVYCFLMNFSVVLHLLFLLSLRNYFKVNFSWVLVSSLLYRIHLVQPFEQLLVFSLLVLLVQSIAFVLWILFQEIFILLLVQRIFLFFSLFIQIYQQLSVDIQFYQHV